MIYELLIDKVRIFGENLSFFYQYFEYSLPDTNALIFHSCRSFMDNGLVTSDGTKVLTVAEYDRFVNFIPMKF